MFQAGDYVLFRNLELIADSHFGHRTPIIFLKSWGVFLTVSFNAHSRDGLQGIKELLKHKLVFLSSKVVAKNTPLIKQKKNVSWGVGLGGFEEEEGMEIHVSLFTC